MDKISLITQIAKITVFVSFLLALFLITVQTRNKLSNRLFACFIILSAVDISGFFMFSYTGSHLNLEMFRILMSLLIMPFFYLYMLSVCYSDFRIQPKHLLHAVPYLIGNIVMAPRLYFADTAGKEQLFSHLTKSPEMIFIRVVTELQFAFYIIAVFLLLKKFREIYRENYTDPTSATYKWLFQITVISTVAHTIVLVKNTVIYTDHDGIFIWLNIIVGLIALSVLCWFVLKALYYPELFRSVDSKLQLVKDIVHTEEANPHPETVAEQDTPITAKINQLKSYMIAQEPYLDPSLTIQQLADQIELPVKELSVLINHHMDQHFFDFVNEYRIQKAMHLLRNPEKRDVTVLEILYEVGFNSKSSFNTSFKKYTNLTPTQYRNTSS